MLQIKKQTRTTAGKNEALAEVSKEKTTRLNANIPSSVYRALKIKAAENDQKINELVVKWINEYLSK